MLWKLDDLSEYDIRRPLVPTGTNLLGLVKHLASVESGYFGVTFGRPFPEPMPWLDDDAEPNADMWATPDESGADMVGLYRRVWAHADATIDALDLDAVGRVPWWPDERAEATRLTLARLGGVRRPRSWRPAMSSSPTKHASRPIWCCSPNASPASGSRRSPRWKASTATAFPSCCSSGRG